MWSLSQGHEGHVVGETAQQGHGGVAVRVDEAGDDEVAGGVDHRGGVGAGGVGREQRGDAVALDEDGATVQNGAGLVHDHHRAPVDEKGAAWGGGLRCRSRATRQDDGCENGTETGPVAKGYLEHARTLTRLRDHCQRQSS